MSSTLADLHPDLIDEIVQYWSLKSLFLLKNSLPSESPWKWAIERHLHKLLIKTTIYFSKEKPEKVLMVKHIMPGDRNMINGYYDAHPDRVEIKCRPTAEIKKMLEEFSGKAKRIDTGEDFNKVKMKHVRRMLESARKLIIGEVKLTPQNTAVFVTLECPELRIFSLSRVKFTAPHLINELVRGVIGNSHPENKIKIQMGINQEEASQELALFENAGLELFKLGFGIIFEETALRTQAGYSRTLFQYIQAWKETNHPIALLKIYVPGIEELNELEGFEVVQESNGETRMRMRIIDEKTKKRRICTLTTRETDKGIAVRVQTF
ncbi:hypothetical protein L596_017880 [Steinernema carpocapsae]|uniref:F-box domain-containing protein n=1 Tax=Steinernema carpocapsae TaxID=34508 RepID=A0A4U5N3E8_STECR|nr:hypothetical protein L596_017880 [Steinernema carpocapsae]